MDKFMFSAGYAVWDDRVYQKGRKKGSRIAYIGGCQHDRCIDRDFGSV